MDFRLDGRVALATGAGRGVGAAIARTLATHGARVIVNDLDIDRAEGVAAAIRAAGGIAIAMQGDVTDYAAMSRCIGFATAQVGMVDVLINNAGNAGARPGMPRLPFWETQPEDWEGYLAVNLAGVMTCSRLCVGGMVTRGWGRIVTIISDAGRTGEQGHEAYSAAKAGAAGFSRALARATGRYGVTANTVSLSTIAPDDEDPDAAMPSKMLKNYIIRRKGQPADVAAVVLLLASEEASWITGQNYPVNGGFSLSL